MSLGGRLLHPEIDGRRVRWDEAFDHVAGKFADVIRRRGPDAVAFYVSGQLLTEDYYAANKLIKGWLGTANIDTNSRLCMASSVAGHKRAFGSDTVPGNYEDLEEADLIVLVGSNLAWCHPVLYQRILAARARRGGKPRLIVVDPRRTATCEGADMHLALAAGSDAALFGGLLAYLTKTDAVDAAYVATHNARCRRGERRCGSVRDTRKRGRHLPRAGRRHRPILFRVRIDIARRDGLFAGRQPVDGRCRQGATRSSTAIWRRAASASPAWAPFR